MDWLLVSRIRIPQMDTTILLIGKADVKVHIEEDSTARAAWLGCTNWLKVLLFPPRKLELPETSVEITTVSMLQEVALGHENTNNCQRPHLPPGRHRPNKARLAPRLLLG